MSSLFRACRSEEPRSGGKMLRGRRPMPSASPYARPEASPAASQSGSPRWLSGLISGAGKLISSVLPSYRSSSSSGYSSDEDVSSDNDADEEGLQQIWNQRENGSELVNKRLEGQLAIVPKSETKLVIEQLLKQETFSRDECDKLTKLIQSRVVDFPSPEVFWDATEELRRTAGNVDLPRALPSHSQRRTLPERHYYSSCKLHAFSPGSSLFEACTPDICNKAVSEAKKWLEEKKSEAKPKYDSECGPCTLNTDMLQYGIEGEGGSPVDMAKSYMRSLPPWRSPSFGGVGFKTPPPSGIRHYRDETSYETANNILPSSKGLKRDRLFLGAWDILDESRQVRLKSIDDELEISKSKQSEASARVEHESFKSLSDGDKRDLHCGDPRTDGAFRLPDGKDADANYQFEKSNLNSSNTVLESGDIIRAMHSTHEISVTNAHPREPTKSLAENQPSQTMEEADNDSIPRDIVTSAFSLVEKDENVSSEIKLMPAGNIRSAGSSDPDDTAKLNDVNTQTSTGVETPVLSDGCSSQLNTVSSIAEINCSSDSRPQEGNSDIPKKANGAIKESSANCYSAEVNKDFNHETLGKGTDTITPQNGTRMKSIERMLTEPQAAPIRRGKKMVVRSRRGRKA